MTGLPIALTYPTAAHREDTKIPIRRPMLRRFAEEYFAKVVLQQEGIGDAQSSEELDDVTVQQNSLPPTCRRVHAVLEIDLVHDDKLRVADIARLRGAEEAQQ